MEIIMPKMGESIMEGTIIKWHKKPGDFVKKDEVLFEIATDKVDAEVPSPESGILAGILTNEQETVPVGTVVAHLSTDAEGHSEAPGIQNSGPVNEAGIIQENTSESTNGASSGDNFYSPVVLNIARKENVPLSELSLIKGSGIGGRVTKKDILAFIEKKKNNKHFKSDKPETPVIYPDINTDLTSGRTEKVPMDHVRQRIMKHMIESRDTSVHVTEVLEVDMSGAYNFIKSRRDSIIANEGIKITYLSLIAYAAVRALREHPLLNSTISGSDIIKKKFVNLGIAVALVPDGLIVPNVKNAHEKNFLGLAAAINETVEKARKKKLTPDDISGGTFTITNYGVFGTLFGTPIINQPEVAILGAGAVIKKPVVVEINGLDTIAVKPMMYLSLSHDHRLIDGMAGGRFLQTVKHLLENFKEI